MYLAIVKHVRDVGLVVFAPETPHSLFSPVALCKALGDILTAKAAEPDLGFSDLEFGSGFIIITLSP